jgi:hypothetical protein
MRELHDSSNQLHDNSNESCVRLDRFIIICKHSSLPTAVAILENGITDIIKKFKEMLDMNPAVATLHLACARNRQALCNVFSTESYYSTLVLSI